MTPPRPPFCLRVAWPLVAALAGGVIASGAEVAKPPVITGHPIDQTVPYRGEATFTVTAQGTPPLSYVWHRGGKTFRGWNRSTLTLGSVTEKELGLYTVTVTNAAGSVTSASVQLIVIAEKAASPPPPKAAPVPPPARPAGGAPSTLPAERLRAGERLRLDAAADGEKPFRFQWFKDGRPIEGAAAQRLEIAAVTVADSGLYVCLVSNAAGERASPPLLVEVRPR